MKKINMLLVVVMLSASHFFNDMVAQNKGLLQFNLDPTMLITGPYEDSENGAINFVVKLAKSNDNNELGVYLEQFNAMDYTSLGALYNRKYCLGNLSSSLECMKALFGLDAGYIRRSMVNEKADAFTVAVNAELRYLVTKNVGLNLTSNYRLRGDLAKLYNDSSPFVFSGYVGLFYNM